MTTDTVPTSYSFGEPSIPTTEINYRKCFNHIGTTYCPQVHGKQNNNHETESDDEFLHDGFQRGGYFPHTAYDPFPFNHRQRFQPPHNPCHHFQHPQQNGEIFQDNGCRNLYTDVRQVFGFNNATVQGNNNRFCNNVNINQDNIVNGSLNCNNFNVIGDGNSFGNDLTVVTSNLKKTNISSQLNKPTKRKVFRKPFSNTQKPKKRKVSPTSLPTRTPEKKKVHDKPTNNSATKETTVTGDTTVSTIEDSDEEYIPNSDEEYIPNSDEEYIPNRKIKRIELKKRKQTRQVRRETKQKHSNSTQQRVKKKKISVAERKRLNNIKQLEEQMQASINVAFWTKRHI